MGHFLYPFAAVLSYIIGSLSFTRIVSKIFDPGIDLESVDLPASDGGTHRLKTVGATTASIKLGPKVGCTIGIMDILKGLVPVLAFKYFYPDNYYHLAAAVFAVVGHNWPIFYRFKGGAGLSTAYGGFIVIDFVGIVISTLTSLIFGLFVIRDAVVAYLSGLFFMLIWLILFKGDWPHILYGIAINIVFILGFIPEMKDYIKQKREGNVVMNNAMSATPMGRGMLKIMDYFRVKKEQD